MCDLAYILTLVNFLLIFTNPLHAASLPIESSNNSSLAILSLISKFFPHEENLTITKCPNLWTPKDEEFKVKEKLGFLGSLQTLSELCPVGKKTSQICSATVSISEYVCKASKGDEATSQLPEVKDLGNLIDPKGLCNALAGNQNLTHKLCDMVKTASQKSASLLTMAISQEISKENCGLNTSSEIIETCTMVCGGKSQQLCKIILQSLRTIISWEEVKEGLANLDVTDPSLMKTNISGTSLTSDLAGTNSSHSTTEIQKVTQDKNILPPAASDPFKQTQVQEEPVKSGVTNPLNVSSTAKPTNGLAIPLPGSSTHQVSSSVSKPISVTDAFSTAADYDLDDAQDPGDKPPKLADDGQLFDDETGDQHPELIDDEDDVGNSVPKVTEKIASERKPDLTYDSTFEDGDPINTHFIFYFIAFVIFSVIGYLAYMRRKRIIALVIEGRSDSRRRNGSFRNRSSSGSYRKLVNNLEEAVTSHSVNTNNVIY